MLSGLDRKDCWAIAEYRGAMSPDGLQHLFAVSAALLDRGPGPLCCGRNP
jgi:hypothetical protein